MQREEAQQGRRDAHERVGRTLAGRWTLESLLGVGGSASVYRARHRNGHRAALKVLHPELSADPRVRRRFLQEGYAANKVGHPGAVRIIDDAEEPDGLVFLVMELLEGQSLATHLDSTGPLPPEEVIDIAVDVLDVLSSAHDAGIVHRDIKPSNVFLTADGEIKVLDFGAARVREAEDFITRSGTTLGTPAFMAPELAAGETERVGPQSDVWAVGATMFQLLTGKTVHQARSSNEALVAAATKRAPSVADAGAGVPRALTDVIDRALAFEPQDRWPNARAMRAALGKIGDGAHPSVADEGHTLPSVPAPVRPPLTKATSRSKVTLGITLALAAALVGAWFAVRSTGVEAPRPAPSATALPLVEATRPLPPSASVAPALTPPAEVAASATSSSGPRRPTQAPRPRRPDGKEDPFEHMLERRK